MDLKLEGKVALVTGSSSGIGFETAKTLAREGVKVVLNGRDPKKLSLAKSQIDGATSFLGDVRKPHDCEVIIDKTIQEIGQIDILVCNVGSGASLPPGEETYQEWYRVLENNLFPTTQMVSAATDALEAVNGNIVCISSICGLEALGCPIPYAGAKAAIQSFVQNASRPLAKRGIRINSVAPGNIVFPGSVWEKKLKENEAAVNSMLEREVALKILGDAEDVGNVVTFLVSPLAKFITGATYVVDGGQCR